jgi:nitrate reductase gamma subunit
MANSLLPPEERHLTPAQVETLDKRRDLGHTFLVIAGQFSAIATVLLLWIGQDLTYSPGWAHPMAFYFAIAISIILIFGITGLVLRRGTPRID